MEEDILNYLLTLMFRGTPCSIFSLMKNGMVYFHQNIIIYKLYFWILGHDLINIVFFPDYIDFNALSQIKKIVSNFFFWIYITVFSNMILSIFENLDIKIFKIITIYLMLNIKYTTTFLHHNLSKAYKELKA